MTVSEWKWGLESGVKGRGNGWSGIRRAKWIPSLGGQTELFRSIGNCLLSLPELIAPDSRVTRLKGSQFHVVLIRSYD